MLLAGPVIFVSKGKDMKFTEFLKLVVSSQSGISSKRVCGILGWLAAVGWITWCVVSGKDTMPETTETFMICCIILLGVDTIPKSINCWRKKKDESKEEKP